MKIDPDKLRDWKIRSALKAQKNKRKRMKENWVNRGGTNGGNQFNLNQMSERRKKEAKQYSELRKAFLLAHPICPVTGERTTQIHHSAHREGEWLNLQRYWIAVSAAGHRWIENNKMQATMFNFFVPINALYDNHCQFLLEHNISFDRPVFYELWQGIPLVLTNGFSLTK